jgi:hypothetical protein
MTGLPGSTRVSMIDIARFYGIFLVYYGHIVERMMYLGNAAAASQYKFINAFHMPLFFILAGFVAKDWSAEQSPGRFALTRATSRVVPLIFFSAALVLLSLAHRPDFPPIPLDTARDYYILGHPRLDTAYHHLNGRRKVRGGRGRAGRNRGQPCPVEPLGAPIDGTPDRDGPLLPPLLK